MTYIKNIIIALHLLPLVACAGKEKSPQGSDTFANARLRTHIFANRVVNGIFDASASVVTMANAAKAKIIAGCNNKTVQQCINGTKTAIISIPTTNTVKTIGTFFTTNQDTIIVSTLCGTTAAFATWLILNYNDHYENNDSNETIEIVPYKKNKKIIIITKNQT